MNESNIIKAYCDGACSGNPGPGGWGAIVVYLVQEHELSGGERQTTNNRMELQGAIAVLTFIKENNYSAIIHLTTDSQYVKNGITSWIINWKRNGWKTSTKDDVKNKDLWMVLDSLNATLKPKWFWVKGHAGHPYNERCDALAVAKIAQYR